MTKRIAKDWGYAVPWCGVGLTLGVLAIKKATDFLGKRFGPGVGLAVFVVLYSSFIITLVTALLGTTK